MEPGPSLAPVLGLLLGVLALAPLPSQGIESPGGWGASAGGGGASVEPLWLFRSGVSPVNRHPVVGVLSQPGDGLSGPSPGSRGSWSSGPPGTSYIAASYVKLVEAGGARVVPLVYNSPWPLLRQTLASLNGLLLPGGSAPKKGLFLRRVKQLLTAAMEFNRAGEYFPVFAECLSFEMLAMIISEAGPDILETFDATTPSTLKFAGPWAKERNLFAWFVSDGAFKITETGNTWLPPALVSRLEVQQLTMENHKYGVSPARFLADPHLSAFFTVLTTTPDDSGKEYVSTVEAREFPFTATQWHPEKSAFEWGNPAYPHSAEAVQIMSAAAIFFVNEARKSQHSFASRGQLAQALIYNHCPVFSGRAGMGHYDQSYVFSPGNASGRGCQHSTAPLKADNDSGRTNTLVS